MTTRRTIRIDESWQQGRGIFGGALAKKALEVMIEDVEDADRTPRSLTMHFCSPGESVFELETEVVRAGSRVTHATARIRGAKGVTTFGSASFCRDRPSAERYMHATMPAVEPASEVREMPRGMDRLPAFFEHVEARFCGSAMPFSSSTEAKLAAWVRLREPAPIGAPVAALLIDTLPPAVCATLPVPRPIASVDFTIHFFRRLPLATLAPDEHCLVSITSRWADVGYTEELRDLWSPRGELLAQCRQLLALL
jgi:acyl-CoA thioesterase